MLISVLLICCSLPLDTISSIPLMCGENLTRPEPNSKYFSGESWADRENCLPYYTAGFE